MDEIEVVRGSCLHGRPVQSLLTAVYFAKPCVPCAVLLRAEGYQVESAAA